MIWNQWRRSARASSAELREAASALANNRALAVPITVEVRDREVAWMVRKSELGRLAESLDPDQLELQDDWGEDIDDIDGDDYMIIIDLEAEEDDAMVLTWDPKAGDNHATWPVAWLMATRFANALGAQQVTVSASYLLDNRSAVGTSAVRLPVIVMRAGCALPTGRELVMNIGRPESIAAIDTAIATHTAWCIVAVQIDATVEKPQAQDLHPIACVARILKWVETSPGNHLVVLAGTDRVALDRIDMTTDAMPVATGNVIRDDQPDSRLPALLLDAAEQLLSFTIPSDNWADDAIPVLQQVAPARLADGAAEIFASLIDTDARVDVLQLQDPSERLMLMVETLRDTITTILDAIDQHDGDLDAARLALIEEDIAEISRHESGAS